MYSETDVIVVSILLPVLGVIFTGLRFYVRMYFRKSYIGIDDWVTVIATLFTCGVGALCVTCAYIGNLGRDGQTVVPWRAYNTDKLGYALVIIEKLAYGFVKLSILLLYRRIFTYAKFRIFNAFMIGLTIVWMLTFMLVEIFQCGNHPDALWNAQAAVGVYCINSNYFLLVFAITDIIGDLLILSMPYPCIKQLNMGKREKAGLLTTFALGLLSTAAGVVRLYYVGAVLNDPTASKGKNGISTPPWLWTCIEASVGIIAANLPTLAALLRWQSFTKKVSQWSYGLRSSVSGASSGIRKKSGIMSSGRKSSAGLGELDEKKNSESRGSNSKGRNSSAGDGRFYEDRMNSSKGSKSGHRSEYGKYGFADMTNTGKDEEDNDDWPLTSNDSEGLTRSETDPANSSDDQHQEEYEDQQRQSQLSPQMRR